MCFWLAGVYGCVPSVAVDGAAGWRMKKALTSKTLFTDYNCCMSCRCRQQYIINYHTPIYINININTQQQRSILINGSKISFT
jgi:hypothetical protein